MAHFRRILVPIDFSDRSRAALTKAAAIAGPEGKLDLFHVLEDLSAMEPGLLWDTVQNPERQERSRRALRELAAQLGIEDAGVHVATTVGNPASEVARFAEFLEADLVVVASHGRTGLARLAMGSVAERIVRLCACPVLVLKEAPPE